MELPVWILAISQIIVDIFIILLIILLIVAIGLIVKLCKQLNEKGGHLLDEAIDMVDYVKESRIANTFRWVFQPKKGFRYWQKHGKKDKDKYNNPSDDAIEG